jgi:hypothetical protein
VGSLGHGGLGPAMTLACPQNKWCIDDRLVYISVYLDIYMLRYNRIIYQY